MFFERVLYFGNLIVWISHFLAITDLGVFPSSCNNGASLGSNFRLLHVI
jgi:hypothetical protein